MSVTRKCKKCGDKISIREMPNGHWIPFDYGSNKQHKCNMKSSSKNTAKLTNDTLPQLSDEIIMQILNNAIENRRVLRIACYLISDSKRWTIRRIVPYEIYEKDKELSVDCYSHYGKEYRDYPISRIRYAEIVTDKPYVPPQVSPEQRQSNQDIVDEASYTAPENNFTQEYSNVNVSREPYVHSQAPLTQENGSQGNNNWNGILTIILIFGFIIWFIYQIQS